MSSQTGPDGSPWDKEKKHKFENKSNSEYFDPCQEAAARSIRCLNRNGGDRQMCTDYFEAYRACKKEWTNKRKKEGGGFFFGS
ncbi:cytochrome c oxidase-assembly factor cox-23, mitochondrial [Hypoxylon sp. NC0597]|nr:cytochrome c oxidase-assembly factor cox-23, mitochondrial [Hypoxylon sp. NC0597]